MADPDVVAGWDAEAQVFDDEAHHALDEPGMRAAWVEVLRAALPEPPARVADLGCGTGSLAVLLAEQGYDVIGLDVSPQMLVRARAKAERAGVGVAFDLGDAADPHLPAVDVVLTRHVAWAVPDLASAVAHWVAALRPGGRLVLVEGLWSNGAGIAADDLAAVVRRHLDDVAVAELDDPVLWGYELVDSRYLLVARRPA
ncbi:MAG: methyltransferase domain-containing protein [Candidatus Nanopelagicales bacterium]